MIKLGRTSQAVAIVIPCSSIQRGTSVHVMDYVHQRYDSRLVYDPSYLEIYHDVFKKCDLSEFYIDVKEAIPFEPLRVSK